MADAMTLEDIKDASAYWLSTMAGCTCPDDADSPGARMLTGVRDSVVENIENGWITLADFNDSGQVNGIADAAPSLYTHARWQQFVDLCAYEEEPEFGEWPDDLTATAGVALFQIADRLTHALCEAWRAGWECPTCGDSGEPLVCDQDTCYGEPDDRGDSEAPESHAEPLPVRTPGEAMAAVDRADRDALSPVSDVLTGPVDLTEVTSHMHDPLWVALHEEDQVRGESRAAVMAAAAAYRVSRFRRVVWTAAAVLAVVGVVLAVMFG